MRARIGAAVADAPPAPAAAIAVARATPAAIEHVLDSVAGFFESESAALEALRRLTGAPGLSEAQALLLGPAHASWLAFTLRTRPWACRPRQDGQPWYRDTWLAAPAGALLGGSLCALWLSLGDSLPLHVALPAFALATLAGAAAGPGAAWLSKQPPHLERFSDIVRQQLSAGRWALLVHGVSWERQAASVALVRECSLDWCAVSVAQGAL